MNIRGRVDTVGPEPAHDLQRRRYAHSVFEGAVARHLDRRAIRQRIAERDAELQHVGAGGDYGFGQRLRRLEIGKADGYERHQRGGRVGPQPPEGFVYPVSQVPHLPVELTSRGAAPAIVRRFGVLRQLQASIGKCSDFMRNSQYSTVKPHRHAREACPRPRSGSGYPQGCGGAFLSTRTEQLRLLLPPSPRMPLSTHAMTTSAIRFWAAWACAGSQTDLPLT